MKEVESELQSGIDAIHGIVKRMETITQIVETVSEIHATMQAGQSTESEEYYIEEMNRWIAHSGKISQELQRKDALLVETQKKYLVALKRVRALEEELESRHRTSA
ncbi:uncharacterized protein NEMAJ01_0567 [Nematocida major]|uniref:uncharacterized protein n=1 Tax=Nematocida major TaxID=1912982 RepID=UPI002007FEA9|nr:uncharacterized protein NEMAJ01_0567 [Nematocida major]KAH9385671.1 hypothetical protein NEMAJ01_0567 [Nematocida major]